MQANSFSKSLFFLCLWMKISYEFSENELHLNPIPKRIFIKVINRNIFSDSDVIYFADRRDPIHKFLQKVSSFAWISCTPERDYLIWYAVACSRCTSRQSISVQVGDRRRNNACIYARSNISCSFNLLHQQDGNTILGDADVRERTSAARMRMNILDVDLILNLHKLYFNFIDR